jgi:hypothetical protein
MSQVNYSLYKYSDQTFPVDSQQGLNLPRCIEVDRGFERPGSIIFVHDNLDELDFVGCCKIGIIEECRQLRFVLNGVRIRQLAQWIVAEELE